MKVTKWLKPSISVSRIGDSASVQAVTRVNADRFFRRHGHFLTILHADEAILPAFSTLQCEVDGRCTRKQDQLVGVVCAHRRRARALTKQALGANVTSDPGCIDTDKAPLAHQRRTRCPTTAPINAMMAQAAVYQVATNAVPSFLQASV